MYSPRLKAQLGTFGTQLYMKIKDYFHQPHLLNLPFHQHTGQRWLYETRKEEGNPKNEMN